jgi:hypothetical protein
VTRGVAQVCFDSVAAPETWHEIPYQKEFEANQKTFGETYKCGVLLREEVPVFARLRVGFGCSRLASPWRKRVRKLHLVFVFSRLMSFRAFDSGSEHYLRYKHLVTGSQLPFVRTTDSERVVYSAANWTQGPPCLCLLMYTY